MSPKISEIYLIQIWRYPYVNLISLRKLVKDQTDTHTRNSELFGIGLPTYDRCLQRISERYIIQNWRYFYIDVISVRK